MLFKLRNKKINIFLLALQICIAGCLFIVCATIIKNNFLAMMESYPREYREGANLAFTRAFLDGINPYKINEGYPMISNAYGIVNQALAALLVKILGCSLLRAYYVLSFIFTFLICGLIVYEVYSISGINMKSWPIFLGVFILAYTTTFRAGHISTVPDYLGLTIGISMLMIARRKLSNKRVLMLAILTVLAFYVKAYFLFFAGPVTIYLFIVNKKDMIKYIVYTAIIGVTSIFIMHYFFPLYFVNNIYFEFAEQFVERQEKANYSKDDVNQYSIEQFKMIFKVYYVLLFAAVICFAKIMFDFISNKLLHAFIGNIKHSKILIYIITFIISIPVLYILGKNKGAYMSYHLQLMVPSIIIIGTTYLILQSNKGNFRAGLICGLCLLTCYTSYVQFGRVARLNSDEIDKWKKVEELCIDAVDTNKNMRVNTLVNALLIDRRDFYTEYTGHHYYTNLRDGIPESVRSNKLIKCFFPEVIEGYEYSNKYNEKLNSMINNGEMEIIMSDFFSGRRYEVPEQYYENVEDVTLKSGQQEWEIKIYTK